MRTERTHFYPQHWLLCHMGLFKFKFWLAAPIWFVKYVLGFGLTAASGIA